jgi:alpha-2-macroglobulin
MMRLGVFTTICAVLASATWAAAPSPTPSATVIPDRFLRRWDPVTVFFPSDVGPAKGGPEDRPERFATLAPAHPGAFRWLDARTLQFRPAEPWPSLARFTWTVGGKPFVLTTLMAAPVETLPADGSEGLEAVGEVALTFPEPLDRRALSRMTTLELRPLPGIDGSHARWLTAADFDVKAVERASRADKATYVLTLHQAIPLGTRTLVHLRLSLDDKESESFKEISFSTAEPFRVVGLGCRGREYPITPDGTRYTREQAIRCDGPRRAVAIEFSSPPSALGPVQGRNLVRFTPAVSNVSFDLQGKTLEVAGDFAWEALYSVRLAAAPVAIEDARGRALQMAEPSELFLYFPRKPAYVKWGASQGIVERFGVQMVPVQGRGEDRLDLRIQPVAPLDRSFWPFPDQPVVVDESRRPPGPGEQPGPFSAPDRSITAAELT